MKEGVALPIPYGVIFVIVTFFSTMTGGVFTLRRAGLDIKPFFAFAAGALVGISFFDLIPEAVTISTEESIPLFLLMGTLVFAFVLFHVLDRYMVLHAMKEGHPDDVLQTSGMVKASGLSIHSLLDGVAIGAAFHVGFELGLVIALAVVFHDFSDGLNTVTVMLRSGSDERTAFKWLLLDSITPIVGAGLTFLIPVPAFAIAFLLAFFSGEFLYLGAADLLPEAHRQGTSVKLIIATIAGILLILVTTRILSL